MKKLTRLKTPYINKFVSTSNITTSIGSTMAERPLWMRGMPGSIPPETKLFFS